MSSELLIINLGGQGELGANIVDINDFSQLTLPLELIKERGSTLVQADMLVLPIRSGVVDQVVGRCIPMKDADDWAGQIAREAFRVLKIGGISQLHSLTGGQRIWKSWLIGAGFTVVTENGNLKGVKLYDNF